MMDIDLITVAFLIHILYIYIYNYYVCLRTYICVGKALNETSLNIVL